MNRYALQSVVRFSLFAALVAAVAATVRTQHLEQYLTGNVAVMILAVQPLIIVTALLVAARIRLLVQPPNLRFAIALKAILLGVGLNIALPARLSELLKPTYLHEHGGVPFSVGLAAVFVERTTDMITMGLLALVSFGLILEEGSLAWLFPVTGALLALPLASRYERPLLGLIARLPGRRFREIASVFVAELAARLRERVFVKALALGALAWGCTFLALHLLVYLVGTIELSIPQASFLILAASVGGAVAVLPGGFGSYEAGAILALQEFGYGFEEALVLAVAMHVTQLAPNVAGALVIVLRERLGVIALAREAMEHVKNTG